MVKNVFVATAPLFEQLTENSEFLNPGRSHTKILLTKEQLMASIVKELGEIFETKSSFSSEALDALLEEAHDENLISGVVGVMGTPSMKNIFTEDSSDWKEFSEKCEMMIRLYEPRLANPVVSIESFKGQTQCLCLNISATLVEGSFREAVSFPLPVNLNLEAHHA